MALWSDLVEVYKHEKKSLIRAVPKWSDEHFELKRGKKMKVSLACQVVSHSAAAGIRFYVQQGEMEERALETADFCEKVNLLWDFINSNTLDAPPSKRAISMKKYYEDMARLAAFQEFVCSWQFIAPNGKPRSLPSHMGWKMALSSIKQLSGELFILT